MNNAEVEKIVKRLREAARAYYETGSPIMSDAEYDGLVEKLTEAVPNHPFLSEVGCTPGSSVVKLPFTMPSLDKRKPDTLRLEDTNKGPYLVMDKLDGISALWVCGSAQKPQLLLRGNGMEGQDVSHCIGGIQGLVSCAAPHVAIRGELIVPKGTGDRSGVNGILHQKVPSKEDLSKIRFVAYQVLKPMGLKRSQQMTWLSTQGFEIVWNKALTTLDAKVLGDLFAERRRDGAYECDGIVVGRDIVPETSLTASNPKDAFAFKMPLDDQRATTVVRKVEWASSRTGNWIPRIQFDPVKIGNATIEFCTGFHGQFIHDNRIGPGAQVVVRRSGDVIPTLEKVLVAAPGGWQEPPKGLWSWDSAGTHCVDTSAEASPEKLALEMEHQLVSLGVEGISKVTTKKLVDNNLCVLLAVYQAPEEILQSRIGKVNGAKLKAGLKAAIEGGASIKQWVRSFLGWPKAFGESRIEAVLALEPSVDKWPLLSAGPKGISATAFAEIQKAVPAYMAWRSQFPTVISASASASVASVAPAPANPVVNKGTYVMSGFRDPALQERLKMAGYTLQDRITKSTNLLLIPDDAKETTKVKAAKEAGIRIVSRSAVNSLF
jgi:DNA ligase (NAD+)